MPELPRRKSLNHAGYQGQTIDISRVLEEILQAASDRGWQPEIFGASSNYDLIALHRRTGDYPTLPRFYLSTGIHGDEPAGPLAALEIIRSNAWDIPAEIWICPCLNPAGMAENRREGPAGKDLNRDYRHRSQPEVTAHTRWLDTLPRFDLAICLHEDWEASGFYLYELNPEGRASIAEDIIRATAKQCPIDPSAEIDGRPASGGIIRPRFKPSARPDWPEAFYLANRKCPWGFTFEAPSDFALAVRVAALTEATKAALRLGGVTRKG